MQKSLYEIQTEYATLVSLLIDAEGEVTPEMEMALLINKEELNSKAEAYALRIIEFKGEAEMIKAEAARLSARAAHLERTGERLKSIIDSAMKQYGVDKIKTAKVTLSFRKSESVEVPEDFASGILRFVLLKAEIDQDLVESETLAAQAAGAAVPEFPTEETLGYFNLKAELSKTKLKESLKEGKAIGEVLLLEKKNLQIK